MSNFSNYLFTAFHRDRRAGKIFNFGEKLPHFPNNRACLLNIFEKQIHPAQNFSCHIK